MIKELYFDRELFNYTYTVSLNDKNYIIGIRFNERAEKWVLSLFDEENNPIVQGLYLHKNSAVVKWIKNEDTENLKLFTMGTINEFN